MEHDTHTANDDTTSDDTTNDDTTNDDTTNDNEILLLEKKIKKTLVMLHKSKKKCKKKLMIIIDHQLFISPWLKGCTVMHGAPNYNSLIIILYTL